MENNNKIYIIIGCCGEYDDHSEWCVKAFKSESKAKEFHEQCENWCKENLLHYTNYQFNRNTDTLLDSPYDPFYQGTSYTGVSYFIRDLDFEE